MDLVKSDFYLENDSKTMLRNWSTDKHCAVVLNGPSY